MDLEDFEAFTRANNNTVTPFKRIIWGLIVTLGILIAFQGYVFLRFMNGAFDTADNTINASDIMSSVVSNSIGE